MPELMNRIVQLKVFRDMLINGKTDPEILPAAIDWLDNAIAEHERDLNQLLQAA